MPVEVADETPVVGLAVQRTRARRALVVCAGGQGRGVEGVDLGLAVGEEADVAAVADAGGTAVDRACTQNSG